MTPSAATFRLDVAPPFDWTAMVAFLGARAVPGVERAEGEVYARTFRLGAARGRLAVAPIVAQSALEARVQWRGRLDADALVARLRRLFDLDADAPRIDAALCADPVMATLVAARPGVRRPGAFSRFEISVRAVLGQQISVRGARTLAGRLAALAGEPVGGADDGALSLCFPEPEAVAAASTLTIGLTRSRARSLEALGAFAAAGGLDAHHSVDAVTAGLLSVPGVGPWTAEYVAMRGLGQDDIFPAGDLGLARCLATGTLRPGRAEIRARAEAWRPYRTYAAFRLWIQADAPDRMRRSPARPGRSAPEN